MPDEMEAKALLAAPTELEIAQFLSAVRDGLTADGRLLARRVCAAASGAGQTAAILRAHASRIKAGVAMTPDGGETYRAVCQLLRDLGIDEPEKAKP